MAPTSAVLRQLGRMEENLGGKIDKLGEDLGGKLDRLIETLERYTKSVDDRLTLLERRGKAS